VSLGLNRVDSAGTARIAASTVIPGLTYSAGTVLDVRFAVTGTSPTQLMARVWKDGTPEPASWQVTGADSSAAMQAAGAVGLMSWLSSTSTNAPTVTDFDGLRVYQADAQQLMAKAGLRQLAQARTTHKSRPVPPGMRTSLPDVKPQKG
jgi:hypothetical protein